MTWRVLAVSGPPGSGKSTLCRRLAAFWGTDLVQFDDYERMTERDPAALRDWIARGAPFSEFSAPGFAEAIEAVRGPLVVEAPLGRAWAATAELFDRALWLECPADLALARKLGAVASDARGDGRFADWTRTFLLQYAEFVRPLLVEQDRRVRPLCDFALDAGQSAETLSTRALRRLGPPERRATAENPRPVMTSRR
ncbi:hypothetical protein [Rhodosalinus sp.]|uniref:hypothetical protein n=1 Tax=Rhodosalinus sp. TaxID=2047741 RepID=UPI003562C367